MNFSIKEPGFIIVDDNVIHWHIDDDGPLLVTFANANRNEECCVMSDEQAHAGLKPWGMDFARRLGFNVVSVSSIGQPSWYRSKRLPDVLGEIAKQLDNLKIAKRIGYGDSMGAFGVSVFADLLGLTEQILLYPPSTKNVELAPFVTGSAYALSLDWSGPFNDGSKTNTPTVILYDPLCRIDHLHAKRYNNARTLAFSGLEHGSIGMMAQTGVLKSLLLDLKNKSVVQLDLTSLRRLAKRTRKSKLYFENMLKKKRITHKRKMFVIANYQNINYDNGATDVARLLFQRSYLSAKNESEIRSFPNGHADIYREYADYMYDSGCLELAIDLMAFAHKIRPNGPYIRKRLELFQSKQAELA